MTALASRLLARSSARAIPFSLQIDLTMRCNELCVHCYRVVEDRPELTTDEIRAVLVDAARAGTLYLTLSGGEIFLRGDVFDLIAWAKRLHFDVRLKSNALLISAAKAGRLRELGVRQVDVSVYSADPTIHDEITKVPGSLARSLEGVVWLRDAGVRVKLNCPLMRPNAATYRDVQTLAEGLGVLWGFDPMITAKTDGDRSPLTLRLGRAALRRVFSDPALNGPTPGAVAAARDPDEVACGAGHTACYVSAYGDVSPCVSMPIVCGNVREQRLSEIWERSARMQEVRAIRVRDLPICSRCAASSFCTRCPGQALVEDGDLYGPSTAACEHARVAAEVAGADVIPLPLMRLRAPSR